MKTSPVKNVNVGKRCSSQKKRSWSGCSGFMFMKYINLDLLYKRYKLSKVAWKIKSLINKTLKKFFIGNGSLYVTMTTDHKLGMKAPEKAGKWTFSLSTGFSWLIKAQYTYYFLDNSDFRLISNNWVKWFCELKSLLVQMILTFCKSVKLRSCRPRKEKCLSFLR